MTIRYGRVKLSIAIEDLYTAPKLVVKAPRYIKWVGDTIEDLILTLLEVVMLKRGMYFIHAGVIADSESSYLLVAPDIGRTTTVLNLCVRDGMNFMADDMVIVDDTYAYCYPRPLGLAWPNMPKNMKLKYMVSKLLKPLYIIGMPRHYLLGVFNTRLEHIPIGKIAKKKAVKKIISYVRGSVNMYQRIDHSTAMRLIASAGVMHRLFNKDYYLNCY